MSIRPIDYQITVNKTGDFTKDANLIRTKPNIEQFQFSEELQKKNEQAEKKVNSTTETEYKKVDKKKHRENRHSNTGYKKRKDRENSDKERKRQTSKLNRSSKIDIKI